MLWVADWGFVLTIAGLLLFLGGYGLRMKSPGVSCIMYIVSVITFLPGCAMLGIFFIPKILR